MGDLRSVLQGTIDTLLENNMLTVKRKDASLFSVVLSEDCFFKSEIKNADYEAQIELQFVKDVSQKTTRMVIDTTQRRATICSEQTVTTGDGELKNTIEVTWDLDFTEDGTRISRILEFVDTYESTRLTEEMLSIKVAIK